jgi:hypothetical protein
VSASRVRHRGARAPLTAALVALAVAGTLLAPVGVATATDASALAQVEGDVTAALSLTQLPAETTPPLRAQLPARDFGIPAQVRDCTPDHGAVVVPACAFGDVSARRTVVLYGNSQAQAWAPALAELGVADHFRLVPIAKPACGTFLDAGYVLGTGHVSSLCEDFARFAIARIRALRPALVVVASTPGIVVRPGTPWQRYVERRIPPHLLVVTPPARTANDFARFVAALAPSGARVVLLSDIPISLLSGAREGPSACLLTHADAPGDCDMAPPGDADAWHRGFLLAAAEAHVPIIDLTTLMCAQARCPLVIHGVLVHFDYLHVSGAFATYVAPALGEMLAEYLP